MTMFTIYGDTISGNCLKIKYVADILGLKYRWVDVDVVAGETQTPELLALNPVGQVPIIQLEDGRVLAQSNAIMRYLSEGSSLIPADAWQRAKMDEWLFWEQYSHETSIAVTRFRVVFKGQALADRDPVLVQKGETALDLMEAHLRDNKWFVGDALSLADLALYAYTQFAPDAGFGLAGRPSVARWLADVSAKIPNVPL
jgi:glutathione S-transferase